MTNPNKNEYQKNTKQFPQKIQANSTQNPEQIPGQFQQKANKFQVNSEQIPIKLCKTIKQRDLVWIQLIRWC